MGVDVGGTGIQIGVVNKEYKISQEGSIPTRTESELENSASLYGRIDL